jgi:hypothetical protein
LSQFSLKSRFPQNFSRFTYLNLSNKTTKNINKMKNLNAMWLALLVFISLNSLQLNAQETKNDGKTNKVPLKKLEGTKVSELTKSQFIAEFGNIPDVQWSRTLNFDEAVFTKNGKRMTAWFDYTEKLVGTTSEANFADIPASGQKTIKSRYKDYGIDKVILYDDNEANETDMILYGLQFDDADNYFVELSKGKDHIVVMVNMEGVVSFFKQM